MPGREEVGPVSGVMGSSREIGFVKTGSRAFPRVVEFSEILARVT